MSGSTKETLQQYAEVDGRRPPTVPDTLRNLK